MSDTTDEERTDPHVALPADARTDQLEIRQSTIGRAAGGEPPPGPRPSTLPPRTPMAPPTSRMPPPLPSARALEKRPVSVPPGAMPRPSDPPPERAEGSALHRQRLAQIEAQLDQARSTIAQQKSELDELRSRVEASEKRAGELLATLQAEERAEAFEQRLAKIEARGDELARRLDDGASDVGLAPRVDKLDERLRVLEEGTAEARIRMRLERMGHRVEELERRLVSIEETQRATSESARRSAELGAAHEERLARIESLFEELADEVKKEREAHDLDGLRARLDDVETLVLKTGTDEEVLARKLGEQARALELLRESMVPPSMPAKSTVGDDLTRIKGIGPKYARLLAEMGITSFAQVAAWTEEDLDHVAEQLGIPAARIKKAGWVENAAKLVSS